MKLPEKNPQKLEECLEVFKHFKYESIGFPMFFLYYNYSFDIWEVYFRNARNFENPEIKAKTPLEACHKMLDFLRTLKK
jgi:hypothetical protein